VGLFPEAMYNIYHTGEIWIIKDRYELSTAGFSVHVNHFSFNGSLEIGVLGTTASINTRQRIITSIPSISL
jgi:hypothetical protein